MMCIAASPVAVNYKPSCKQAGLYLQQTVASLIDTGVIFTGSITHWQI
jgi:hypothetical protein